MATYEDSFKRKGVNGAVEVDVSAFFAVFYQSMRSDFFAVFGRLAESSYTSVHDFVFVQIDVLF